MPDPDPGPRYANLRRLMVRDQLAARGIRDPSVLAAMETVPRELFVPTNLRASAYDDGPLPIGEGQTISQPYIVAFMAEALELTADDRVLEIGTGSGYGAAVLGRLAARVITIERFARLTEQARLALTEAGIDNVEIHTGDGSLGHPAAGPYDAIVVTAGGPDVPRTLKAQMAPGGRLVMPIGESRLSQDLVRLRKTNQDFVKDWLAPVRFVPLIGVEGWQS